MTLHLYFEFNKEGKKESLCFDVIKLGDILQNVDVAYINVSFSRKLHISRKATARL